MFRFIQKIRNKWKKWFTQDLKWLGYLHQKCKHSGTNSCKAKIPEVTNIKHMSDAKGFLSMLLGLDLLKMLITAYLNRTQNITISRNRTIWDSCFFWCKSDTLPNIVIFFTSWWLLNYREADEMKGEKHIEHKLQTVILHTSTKGGSSSKRPVIVYLTLTWEWLKQGQYHLRGGQKIKIFLITNASLGRGRVKKNYPISSEWRKITQFTWICSLSQGIEYSVKDKCSHFSPSLLHAHQAKL